MEEVTSFMKIVALRQNITANIWILKHRTLGHGQNNALEQEPRVPMQENGIQIEFMMEVVM